MKARKKSLLMLGLVLALLLAVVGSTVLLARVEPGFYKKASFPADEKERVKMTGACNGEFTKLISYFNEGQDGDVVFEAAWINNFFKENFESKETETNTRVVAREDAEALARQGISDPRISFDKDRLCLGFRYKNAFISTVISIEMRIWLVDTDINTFAVEILNRRAGALPFPTQALLEEMSTMARKRKIEVNWYRHDGHPVALLRVQSNGARPTAKFDRFNLEPGKLNLRLVANEPATAAAPGQAQNRPPRTPLPPEFDLKTLGPQASPTP
jgi:hypothetical protein